MTYEIKLPQFEGPFDLLLFFIERDELDIYDIPIARITDEFLDYLHHLQKMNIEVASEFILVAATLMRIKAKMLLPRKEVDEHGEEIDPRQELVERLIEYKKYKSIVGDLQKLEERRQEQVARGNAEDEMKKVAEQFATEAELDTLSLYRLMRAFERVMMRLKDEEERRHSIIQYEYTIEGQKTFLLEVVADNEKHDFVELFDQCQNRIHAIFTFLAILELVQLDQLHLTSGDGYNNFWLSQGAKYGEAESA